MSDKDYQSKMDALIDVPALEFDAALDLIADEMEADGVFDEWEDRLIALSKTRDQELKDLVSTVLGSAD